MNSRGILRGRFIRHSAKQIIGVFTLLCAFGASASLISVSVSGTADTTEMGYTQGESYTFTWIVNDGYTGSTSGDWEQADEFSSTKNRWFSILTADPWLWASVSGDGLTGTYSRPDGFYAAPYDQLQADINGLRLRAGAFSQAYSLGLLVDGVEVWDVIAHDLNIPGLDYSDTSFVNPATYLGSYIGTYTSTGSDITLYDASSNNIKFTTTSVIIAAVPEPATALLFGIGGMGAWLLRGIKRKGRS